MPPKLSIIIPCYNCQKTLREAVESCYIQGFTSNEFEVVMVDDGSTDKTKPLMEELATKYSNIVLFFHEQNKGGGAARNTAVANTRAEVIFCLDSDDILPPDTLTKMFKHLKEKHCDAVTIHRSINFNGTDTNSVDHVVTMSYVGEKIPFESLFQKAGIMCGLYQVFMFTKVAFTKAGGYPSHHAFDTQGFAWRFLAAGLHAETCPDTSYLLRVNFHESYYLREYQKGKINKNWQLILQEHLILFNPRIQDFIRGYDCKNFTKNIFSDLSSFNDILVPDYQKYLGLKKIIDPNSTIELGYIHRNSLRGIYMRVINKLKP